MSKSCFLGGTCNGSSWREKLIPLLTEDVAYFNPVVANWNAEAQQKERWHRQNDDFALYVVTPKMTGVFSIAEVVDDSNKRPKKTLAAFLEEDDGVKFEGHQLKSIRAVENMVDKNGCWIFKSLQDIADFLNKTS